MTLECDSCHEKKQNLVKCSTCGCKTCHNCIYNDQCEVCVYEKEKQDEYLNEMKLY